MSFQEDVDPFSSDVIKEIAPLLARESAAWDGFQFQKTLESGFLQLNEIDSKPLPNLKTNSLHLQLQNVSLPDLSPLQSPPTSDSGNVHFESLDGESDQDDALDVWKLPDIQKRRSKGEPIDWEFFLDKSHTEPYSGYLSEAGPKIVNAILDGADREKTPSVKAQALLNALLELGMGRGSTLFDWQEQKKAFVPLWPNVAADGYSSSLLQNCFEVISEIGTKTRILREDFETLEEKSQQLSQSQIAFLSASRSVLYAVHHYLEASRPGIESLLQLTSLVTNTGAVIRFLKHCADAVQSCPTDDLILSTLITQATESSFSHPGIDRLIQQIFSRTSRPVLTLLSEEVGLKSSPEGDSPFEKELGASALWTNLFPSEVSRMILETQQSLKLLRVHSPSSSILACAGYCSSSLLALEPAFSFQDICDLQTRSLAYEEAMRLLITSAESSASSTALSTPASDSFGMDAPDTFRLQANSEFRLDPNLFERNLSSHVNGEHDDLHDQVMLYLEEQEHEPSPFQLGLEEAFHLSIAPLVSAQHRLLSFSLLQLLFQGHNLISHLNLQRHFHFLANAFFSSRLATALFDSDQTSGEGRRHTGGSTGLRLEARDTWPPASSELRLVLMGILSESIVGTKYQTLEDSMSFAIRDLTPDELEKCRNLDSIHALDFLRLQYRPSNDMIDSIITPEILDKYDRVFQHLLRTLRVQSATQSLLRQGFDPFVKYADRKLVLEMHHFVTTLADFYHNTAIELSWRKFEAVMQDAKAHIDNKDYEMTLSVVKGQAYLRALHERTLDKILHALLLKKKQLSARQILEEIYSVILRFVAEHRTESSSATVNNLAAEFRTKIGQFIDALGTQARSSKHTLEPLEELESESDDDGDLFEYLLIRLDMSGYWTAKGRRNLEFEALTTPNLVAL